MVDHARSTRSEGEPRLDLHNANVNEDLAEAGLCGTIDLVTGAVCRLPALHEGGCDFVGSPRQHPRRDEQAGPGS